MLEVSELTHGVDEVLTDQALQDAQQATLATQANLHRQRAKVARLIAGQEEVAAEKIDAKLGGHAAQKTVAKQAVAASIPLDGLAVNLKVPLKKKTLKKKKGSLSKPQRRQQKKPIPTDEKNALNPSFVKAKAKLTKKIPSRKRRKGWHARGQSLSDWISRRPPWLVSLASHGILLLGLAFFTFATLQDDPFVLTASLIEADEWAPELPAVQFVSFEETVTTPSDSMPEFLEIETPIEMPIVEPMTMPIVDYETPLASEQMPSASSMMTEVLTKKAVDGSQGTEESTTDTRAPTKAGKVQFFGVQEEASRIVFVVDNSGSMQRGRMETTLDELNYAVQRLKEGQQFYVIFYSDQAYPMFYPESVDVMQPATRENKKKLAKWLRTVEICLGGRLLDAMEMASKLEPQVVFLMSDGDIRSQRVMQSLTNRDAWKFRVHSFGMEVRTKQHAENLAAIAEANEGAFTVVDVRPKAIRRSMVKPIPYHREPAEVWGSAVQVWN